jgi:tetratricopeptide (TPR) repeat protein
MALANGVQIVWLDTYIGREGEYREFKRKFQSALEPEAEVRIDAIDTLIRLLEENAGLISFADTSDKAIEIIKAHNDKQIIFISSGSLGQQIIPHIVKTYSHVHRFYIFCGYTMNYVEFGLNYLSCLKMFDHEMDLLLRLVRDISSDKIKEGEIYMSLGDAKDALKCFEIASTLNITANTIDELNVPCLTYLKKLNGDRNNMGLIQRANDMLHQQQPIDEENSSS